MNIQEAFSRLKAALSIGQHKRLLQLETAFPSATLVVERAEWQENVNGFETQSKPPARVKVVVA